VTLDDRPRCWWPGGNEGADALMLAYHDDEWAQPVSGDRDLFERLSLECFQAGLSWATILRKRNSFRAGFADFDPVLVAAFGDADRARLLADAGIVRNRAKIEATIANAAALLALAREYGSLAGFLAAELPRPAPVLPRTAAGWSDIPSSTPESIRLSANLKRRGFSFVGPTVVYAFMQSVGLVDDHLPGCFRYRG
jgi:DNA-3-methyladenine glycosylase I